MSKICKKCGFENEDNSTFCGKCGNRLDGTDATFITKFKAVISNKKVLSIILIIIILIVVVGATLTLSQKDVKQEDVVVNNTVEQPKYKYIEVNGLGLKVPDSDVVVKHEVTSKGTNKYIYDDTVRNNIHIFGECRDDIANSVGVDANLENIETMCVSHEFIDGYTVHELTKGAAISYAIILYDDEYNFAIVSSPDRYKILEIADLSGNYNNC